MALTPEQVAQIAQECQLWPQNGQLVPPSKVCRQRITNMIQRAYAKGLEAAAPFGYISDTVPNYLAAQPIGAGAHIGTSIFKEPCDIAQHPVYTTPQPAPTLEPLTVIAEKLRRAGATLPAPQSEGTIESAMKTGLSIALALVETEIDAAKLKGGA